jgi:hypothetical protein
MEAAVGYFLTNRAQAIRIFRDNAPWWDRKAAPELVLDTAHFNIDHCVRRLEEYVEHVTGLKAAEPTH